jgi:hypothetical protein
VAAQAAAVAAVDAAADVADQETDMNTIQKTLVAMIAGALVALPAAQAWAQAAAPAARSAVKQKTFGSPEEAASALIAAVRAKSVPDLLAVVGPTSGEWLFSGDTVSDANDWSRFLAAYDQKNGFEKSGDKAILVVGGDTWPFPAPLVQKAGKWTFDAAAGREEIINRRIGRNELDTMQALLAVVDAQREYAASDADGNGFADYARRFRSSPGKKDGLYWPTEGNAPQSPLGPLVAVASREGYGKQAKNAPAKDGQQAPFHGYYYRIMTSQGKDAAGGAYDYIVGNKLLGGFAVVAWPASYRNSGVMTFIVNHDGVVYEKDLGPQTASIAAGMTRYNPDSTWRKAQ